MRIKQVLPKITHRVPLERRGKGMWKETHLKKWAEAMMKLN